MSTTTPETGAETTPETGAETGADEARRSTIGEVEQQVDVLARRIKRTLLDRASEVGEGLSPAGFMTLRHLVAFGPVRQVDLVERFASEKGAVSRLVQHLVEAGLAERSPDPDDRRAQRVAATDHAVAVLGELDRRWREGYRARLAPLGTDELQQLAELLGRYNAALEAPAD